MSDLKDQDFPVSIKGSLPRSRALTARLLQSSDVIANLGAAFEALSEKEKKSEINKVNATVHIMRRQ